MTTTSTSPPAGMVACGTAPASAGSKASKSVERRATRVRPDIVVMKTTEARIGQPGGCGGIGRRARFRAVWGQPRGGSSPLIRIATALWVRGGHTQRPPLRAGVRSSGTPRLLDYAGAFVPGSSPRTWGLRRWGSQLPSCLGSSAQACQGFRWRHRTSDSTFHVLTFLGGDVEIAGLAHLDSPPLTSSSYVRQHYNGLAAQVATLTRRRQHDENRSLAEPREQISCAREAVTPDERP